MADNNAVAGLELGMLTGGKFPHEDLDVGVALGIRLNDPRRFQQIPHGLVITLLRSGVTRLP